MGLRSGLPGNGDTLRSRFQPRGGSTNSSGWQPGAFGSSATICLSFVRAGPALAAEGDSPGAMQGLCVGTASPWGHRTAPPPAPNAAPNPPSPLPGSPSPSPEDRALTVKPMPTVAEKEPGMNLPWSNWTSRDVFPTPLSPTRMVCKGRAKEHQELAMPQRAPRVLVLGEGGEGEGSRGWQQQEQGGSPAP